MTARRKNDSIIMVTKKYKKLYEYVEEVCAKLSDETEKEMFKRCFLNTLETTVEEEKDDVFIKTGDIPAMWLRDSSVQVSHYVRFAGEDKDVKELIRGTLKRQFESILTDPYANAFNKTADGRGHKDITKLNDRVWERKYELDSLIYPLWLLNRYYFYSKDKSVFNELFFKCYEEILKVMKTEQFHDEKSDYSFKRTGEFAYDTLPNDGRGEPSGYTGMVWSAFRSSDDRCVYHYLVPSNMFAVAVLKELSENLKNSGTENPFEDKAQKLIREIDVGIKKFALTDDGDYELTIPTDAVILGGDIAGTLDTEEIVNGTRLLHISMGQRILFAVEPDKQKVYKKGDAVKFSLDAKKLSLSANGEKVVCALERYNKLSGKVSKQNVKTEIGGKKKKSVKFTLQTMETQFDCSEAIGNRLVSGGGQNVFNKELEFVFSPEQVKVAEEGIPATVDRVLDYGNEFFAECAVGDKKVYVAVEKGFTKTQVKLALDSESMAIFETEHQIRLV